MKVVKPGRAQKGWAREFECTGNGNKGGGCGATLLVEFADVYMTASGHYVGSTDYYRTFMCGTCGVETDIHERHWPPGQVPTKSEWLAKNRNVTLAQPPKHKRSR